MINKLVLSGGGINGIIFLGIIKYLETSKQLKNINTFVGSSIGSIINTLVCIGYTYNELKDFILDFDFTTIIEYNISNIFTDFGINLGEKFEIILKCLIKNKLNKENISLQEFYNKTNKNNIIITTCLNDKSICYIDHISHPKLMLITALRMSTCIPLYFKPIIYEKKFYIDGSVLNHFGIDYFNKKDRSVFGVCLVDNYNSSEIVNLEKYIMVLLEIILNTVNYKKCKADKRVILINNEYNILDFTISNKDKKKLINIGYKNTEDFFKKND
tara:strand:+ start:1949 stop:2764 length:816 start_codon:yes stop_codon:yes gene_type:complete